MCINTGTVVVRGERTDQRWGVPKKPESEWDGGWQCNFQASRGGSRAIPSWREQCQQTWVGDWRPSRAALTNHQKRSFFTTADHDVKIYYNAQEATWAGQGQDWRVQESLWYSPSLPRSGCHRKTGQQPPDRLTFSQPAWFEAPGKGFMFRKAHWEAGAATPWAGEDDGERADWCTSGWDRFLAVGFSSSSHPLPLSWRATIKQGVVCSTTSLRRVKLFWGRHKGPGLQTSWNIQMGVFVQPQPLSHWGMCPGQRY